MRDPINLNKYHKLNCIKAFKTKKLEFIRKKQKENILK